MSTNHHPPDRALDVREKVHPILLRGLTPEQRRRLELKRRTGLHFLELPEWARAPMHAQEATR